MELRDPELACNFVEDSGIGERGVDSERGGRVGGEVLAKYEDDDDTYGSMDGHVARGDKSGGDRRCVSDALTPAIPTNNEPSQRDAGARAGSGAVTDRPKTELITTLKTAKDFARDAAGRKGCTSAGAPDMPAGRTAVAVESGRVGQSRSVRNSWADESDSDREWLGHEADVPTVRDVQIARSALRSCIARDASQSRDYCCRRSLFQKFANHPKESNVGSTPILGSNRVEGGRGGVENGYGWI